MLLKSKGKTRQLSFQTRQKKIQIRLEKIRFKTKEACGLKGARVVSAEPASKTAVQTVVKASLNPQDISKWFKLLNKTFIISKK